MQWFRRPVAVSVPDPLRRLGTTSTFAALILAMLVVGLYNIYLAAPFDAAFGLVSKYRTDFWLVAYSDGVLRRGLVGQLVRWSGVPALSAVTLNLVSAAVLAACLTRILLHVIGRERRDVWFTAFLLAGPMTAVLFEVAGDLLQVSLLLFLVFSGLVRRLPPRARLACALAVGLLMVLVHEASSFVFLPAVYVVYALETRRTVSVVWLAVVACVPGLVWNQVVGNEQTHVSSFPLLTLSGGLITADRLPPMSALLAERMGAHFGSPLRAALVPFGIFRALFWPLLTLAVHGRLYDDRRALGLFLVLLAASSPLYVIAGDWGRFSAYTLLVSLVIARAHVGPDTPLDTTFWRLGSRIAARVAGLWPPDPLHLIAVVPFLYASHPFYRVVGLQRTNGMLMVLLVAVAAAVRLWRRPVGVEG